MSRESEHPPRTGAEGGVGGPEGHGKDDAERDDAEREHAERDDPAADADSDPLMVDVGWTVTGGVLAALFAFGGMWAVGAVGSYEAQVVLEATVPAIRFLSSSIMTAAAAILALMLTLLSFSATQESEFKETHYLRIRQISWLTAATMIAATLLLLLLSVPLEESEELRRHYEWIYYATLVASAVLGGMFVTVVLMLYHAIQGVVDLLRERGESPLVPD